MFLINEYDSSKDCKTLDHSEQVFHDAMDLGDGYFHVKNPAGQDYDIEHKTNNSFFEEFLPSYIKSIFPEYPSYREDDEKLIATDMLSSFDQLVMLKLNEYSIAVARAALRFTDTPVYFMDERATWFLGESPNLHINEMPTETENTMFLVGPMGETYANDGLGGNKKCDISIFHSVFLLQWMLNGKNISDMKYFMLPIKNTVAGIGGLLSIVQKIVKFVENLPIDLKIVYGEKKLGKFKLDELQKYFNIDFESDGYAPENTIDISEETQFAFTTWQMCRIPSVFDTAIIRDTFKGHMDEYFDAVLGGKKTLGLLIRGTDYKKVGFDNSGKSNGRSQSSVEDMIPTVKEWLKKDGYDIIFLATEDLDILNTMRGEFGKKVIAIAQERHSSSELKDGQLLNDFEKEIYSPKEYDNRVMETTVNYFYALYILSKCTSFLCSGQNNGWDSVRGLNCGKFLRCAKFISGKLEETSPNAPKENVRSDLRTISIEGCDKIGEGAFGTVYKLWDNFVVKTFRDDIPFEYVDQERALSRFSLIHDVPTAIPFDVVNVDGCLGIVYEMLNTDSLGSILMNSPENREDYINLYADLMRKLHSTAVNDDIVPSVNDRYHEYADKAASYYTKEELNLIHEFIDSTPSPKTMLHGDLHTKNILVQKGELFIIDMAEVCYGHPIFDLASMALVMDGSIGDFALPTTGMTAEVCSEVWDSLLKKYFKTEDEEVLAARKNMINLYKLLRAGVVQVALPELPDNIKQNIVNNVKEHLIPLIGKLPELTLY